MGHGHAERIWVLRKDNPGEHDDGPAQEIRGCGIFHGGYSPNRLFLTPDLNQRGQVLPTLPDTGRSGLCTADLQFQDHRDQASADHYPAYPGSEPDPAQTDDWRRNVLLCPRTRVLSGCQRHPVRPKWRIPESYSHPCSQLSHGSGTRPGILTGGTRGSLLLDGNFNRLLLINRLPLFVWITNLIPLITSDSIHFRIHFMNLKSEGQLSCFKIQLIGHHWMKL